MNEKDPAVLLYTSDFLTGVMDMDMEERGQYITLLCYQHQRGHISEKTIRLLVGNVSDNVLSHFKKDENGLLFNSRMDLEKENRKKFTESRRENGKKGGRPKKNEKTEKKPNGYPNGKPNKNHMGNENDNENDNKNINENIDIFNYYENNIGSITNVVYEKLNYWCEYFTKDIIKYAIDISCENNVRTMNYIDKILFNWNNAGYKVLADCKNGKKTNVPEWMDKKLEVKKLDEKDKEEIENLLKEFR